MSFSGGSLEFRGRLDARDLGAQLILTLRTGEWLRPWASLVILGSIEEEQRQWRDFVAGEASSLPGPELERIAVKAVQSIDVHNASACPGPVAAFCRRAGSQELLVDATRLRGQGHFPSLMGLENGRVLASRLALNWNLLLIQERSQRLLLLQGVSSSDALLLPEVGAFYWTDMAPDIVNSGREEQGSVSV